MANRDSNFEFVYIVMSVTGLMVILYVVLQTMSYHSTEKKPVEDLTSYEQGYEDGLREGLKNITPKCWYENNKNPDILKPEEFNKYIKVMLPSEEHKDGWPVWYLRPKEG